MKCKILIISLIGIGIVYVLFGIISNKFYEYETNKKEVKIEEQLSDLKNQFEIKDHRISGYFSEDYDASNTWNGELYNPKLPNRVFFNVNFDIIGDKIYYVDSFLINYNRIIAQVKKVTVLMNYIDKHQYSKLEIRFVNNKSLSDKAKNLLYEDLGLHFERNAFDTTNTDSIESKYKWITNHIDSAIYCYLILPDSIAYQSYFTWIILPNNRLLLRSTDKMIFSDRIFSEKGDLEINKDPIIIFDYKGNRIKENKP